MTADVLSVKEICDRLKVSESVVLAWLNNGELPGINVKALPGGPRHRWRVEPADFEAFVERRRVRAVPKVARRRPAPPKQYV